MEYYSAIKNNEILPFATTWMDLEGIMVGEISQREKEKYCVISSICGILKTKQNKTNTKLIEKEVRFVFTRGSSWRRGN